MNNVLTFWTFLEVIEESTKYTKLPLEFIITTFRIQALVNRYAKPQNRHHVMKERVIVTLLSHIELWDMWMTLQVCATDFSNRN